MSVRAIVKSIQDIMRQDTGVDGDAQRISQLCWMFFLKIIDDQDEQLELMQDNYRSPIPAELQWRNWAADPEGITGDELQTFVNGQLFPTLKNLALTGKPGDRRRVVKDVFEDAYNYMKSGQLMRQVINKINGIDFNNLADRQHFGDIYEQILADLQSAGNAGEYYTPRAVTAFMVDRIDPKPGETRALCTTTIPWHGPTSATRSPTASILSSRILPSAGERKTVSRATSLPISARVRRRICSSPLSSAF
jgi:type I restriction enzyme M protein